MSAEQDEKKAKPTAQQQADAWNRSVKVGAEVTYEKSAIEGRVVLRTVREAYVMEIPIGSEFVPEAFVNLDHIGLVLLSKTNPFTR
ncbi:hypothetical protein BLA39750_01275 [Burkholderia lata]|uniref:Uncharacterized protein n=1 Tax=Burkholderia lata (strain ATCC 17760 / DSM 23089 / LMG 22485 / NCIMB 9086 / R18194 / 383) TaxID=482957 RepID=A0A6P2UWY6_BURL3|nr:hypothetical protein [Burkholderia lata]VWC82056.1 hypothetical protein BLA39750_01275 [Burkholderia lata]